VQWIPTVLIMLYYLWGATGFVYNEQAVAKCLPHAPVNSLAMLFDKEVVEKLSACGVSLLDSPVEVFPAALIYLGLDPNTEKAEDMKRVTELLVTLAPYLRRFDSFQFVTQLGTREICLAQAWSSYGNIAVFQGAESVCPQNMR